MLSVGSLVWIFDHDSRGARTPAERFREAHIEGETSRSWVCEGNKIPKTHRGPVLRREDPASGRRTTNPRDRCSSVVTRCVQYPPSGVIRGSQNGMIARQPSGVIRT